MSDPPPTFPLQSRVGILTLDCEVGKGISSVVYASRSEHGLQYAVKAICNKDLKRYKRAIREITIHAHVGRHSNIVPLVDAFTVPLEDEWPSHTCLVLPLAPADLHSFIVDHGLYLNNQPLIRSVYLQIVSAVDYCHSRGVFHRDIKSENILAFDGGRRVMLADFGLATTSTRSRDWGVGTSTYMSPECIGGQYKTEAGYSPAATDIWSLGIVLINLLTARFPWHKATLNDPSFLAYCCAPNNYLIHSLPFSQQAHAILCHIFIEERQRLTVTELVDWVTATPMWYDEDAVFEGCRARWRRPEDCVGFDGWVCGSCAGAPPRDDNDVCTPPPPLATLPLSQSNSPSETLVTTRLAYTDASQPLDTSQYRKVERDPFPWFSAA